MKSEMSIEGTFGCAYDWAVALPATAKRFSPMFPIVTFRIDDTRRGQWPGVDIGGALQEATVWVFFNINGQWYGTGGEGLRPNQTEKDLTYRRTSVRAGSTTADAGV